jgi:hypothetical protein
MLHDFDEINDILNAMADEGTLEPLAEPIDCDDAHPMDWAEVTGLVDEVFDEMYPNAEMETMVDEDGFVWYVG